MMRNSNFPEKQLIAARQMVKEKEYWVKKLSGDLAVSTFFYDKKMGENKRTCDTVDFKLEENIFPKLMKFSKGSDHTLHIILTAALVLLVNKYTGNQDVIIGTPIYKQHVQAEFLNTMLVLRNSLHDRLTFKELLLQVKETLIEATENYSYPINLLSEELDWSSPGENFTLVDIVLLLENIHDRSYIKNVEPNIIFSFSRSEQSISGVLEYNSLLYNKATTRRIVSYFTRLLASAVANLDKPIPDLDILAEEEKKQLLIDLNDTAAQYPVDKTIQQLFEEQVANTPNNIAVEFEGKWLTYSQLNKKANQLAGILREKGVRRDDIAAILLEPSLEVIVSILAILKAGGAYFPIDTQTPCHRIISMLEDCNVSLVLTTTADVKGFPFTTLMGFKFETGSIYLTPPRPVIRDLNSLPFPDRSLLDYEKYCQYIGLTLFKNSITIMGTRGCPYKCAYCHKIWPKQHVIRSAENILDEVKLYYDVGVRRFAFVDDIFNLNRENSTRFFKLLIKNRMDVQLFFTAGLRGDILTPDYIDLMVEAGTVTMGVALETASPRLQKLIGKNLDLDNLKKNLDYLCEKHPQVITELYSMHGFPTETEKEALMTLDFIKGLHWIDFPAVHILKIFLGTDMAKLAMENGILLQSIIRSQELAFHELPETLPFEKSFTVRYQADYLENYFLLKERLLNVLPLQLKLLTENEIVQKYDSWLPTDIKSLDDLLKLAGITREELGPVRLLDDDTGFVPDLNRKLRTCFRQSQPADDALRLLLLDVSQYFSGETEMLYDLVEAPLGPMSLLTYLREKFGTKINGKVAKSRIDFDSYDQLKALLDKFRPDIIGIRSLTFHKHFFHKILAMIRNWGFAGPLISGGPYATSDYRSILQDRNLDLVVLGEGELTLADLIEKIIEHGGKLPPVDVLKEIKGIAFNQAQREIKKGWGREILFIDKLAERLPEEPDKNLTPGSGPGDMAYVIYTSGSSGEPKGTAIEHRNVVRLMVNDRNLFDFNSNDVWTMFHSIGFDFSVWEMYGALLYGGKLLVIPRMVARDHREFLRLLKEHKVTVLNQTPFAFYNLADEESRDREKNLNLKYVIFGGEALQPLQLKAWKEKYPGIKLINMFGITETTVHATYKEITPKEIVLNISNIGKPIPTIRLYVMDRCLNLLPIGAAGELCVGGDAPGRGYINRPRLTAEKFARNPHCPTEIIYRSGDLVRYLPEGELEYLGRIDRQVKIRGFRIELAEIENQMLDFQDIKEAVVLPREGKDGDKYLCAYIVPKEPGNEPGNGVNISKLKEHLARKLPYYMMPTCFIPLKRIPLNQNGKVNRKILPEPEWGMNEGEYIPPADQMEKQLVGIWAEVLGMDEEKISMNDDFFDLGGHSLKATIVVSMINRQLHVELPLVEIFTVKTIRELSVFIHGMEAEKENDTRSPGHLVKLRRGTKEDGNMFLIHPGTGEVDGYVEFCNHLNPRLNYWGIRANGFENCAPQNLTIPGLAGKYLEEIKNVQPHGPYRIGGWSLGGIIAFEMVRQLEQMKENIQFFAIIDSDAPGTGPGTSVKEFTYESELNWVLDYLADDTIREKLDNVSEVSRMWPLIVEHFEAIHYDAGLIKKQIPAPISRALPNFDQLGLRELIYQLNLGRTFYSALSRYFPREKINTPIHFFAANGGKEKENIKLWNQYTTHPIRFYKMEGDHYSIFMKPNVAETAKLFDRVMNIVE
jgi:amino acid adenylation domain-containing protein